MRKLIIIIAIAVMSFACASTNETHYRIGVEEADAFTDYLNKANDKLEWYKAKYEAGEISEEVYKEFLKDKREFVVHWIAVLDSKLDKTDYEMQVLEMMIAFLAKLAMAL